MRSLLLRRLAPLLVMVALVGTACGSTAERPAATVNGADISVGKIHDELETVQANPAYRKALEGAYGPSAGAGKGTFRTSFLAAYLTVSVYYVLLEQELTRRKVTISASDDADGRKTMEQQIGQLGSDVLAGFPDAYLKQIGHEAAIINVSQATAAKQSPSDPNGAFQELLFTTMCSAKPKVSVNPRYGRWDTSPCAGRKGLAKVTPPETPKSG